jgi:hypothetical protein
LAPLVPLLALVACAHGTGAPAGPDRPADSVEILDSAGDSAAPSNGDVWITEAMSADADTLVDGDGDPSDWIELFAAGTTPVALAGWGLSDDDADPWRYTFPDTTLVPGEYRLVYASGKGAAGPAGELHTSFALDRAGESLALTRPDGTVASTLALPPLEEDVSYGLAQTVTTTSPVDAGTEARLSLAPADGWIDPEFDDTAWTAVHLGIGFDGGVTDAISENAALDAATTQSSDGYGYTGQQAADGEPGTFSHTGDGDLAPWWQVDLGADYLVDSVTLLNRVDCCQSRLYNITVTVLDAEGAPVWISDVLNPVAEGGTPTDPGSSTTLTPAAPVLGRAVRVDKVAVNGAGSSEWLSLGEVVVTARLASAYAAEVTTDVGAAMAGISSLAAVRVPFDGASGAGPPTRATLRVASDDGFAAWIDGTPVASLNAGDGVATATHDGTTTMSFPVDPTGLGADSVLAIAGLNIAEDDDDFLLAPALGLDWITTGAAAYFYTPTPGAPNGAGMAGKVAAPTADPPRGFFDTPTTVTLACATAGATLVYTLDGTAPTLENGTAVPAADTGSLATVTLPVDTTAIVRAAAFRDDWAPSDVVTDTYLFLADVVRQPAAPAGLPTTWDGISEAPVSADYEMDPDVVDDPAYTADLLAGLREIPTLSIVMDPADLFGDDGIYTNSAERGDGWERPASVELLLPDGSTGFAETCGIRIHGWGWRYHSSTKKHSFRLGFSGAYGASKLDYPLFPDAPITRFDNIVLRAGGSKTWLDFRDPAQAQYLHDAFARDTARDMGKADGHATFVHLYLNSLYWGLYDPVERPDAGFGAAYFGGDDDEYDAINRRTVTNEAIDGDLVAYDALLALADADLSAGYDAIADMLDVDDLIDYMLIHQYTVNRDGPCCAESNNMRGVRKREDGARFRFFVWDMEYSLWDANDATNVDIDVAGSISHVYTRLRSNADFRARYAERARMHLTGAGALTPAASIARYQARAEEIYDPLVAESARWGDTYRDTPYTRDVEWEAERTRLVTEFFPDRTAALIAQLTAAGLYEP